MNDMIRCQIEDPETEKRGKKKTNKTEKKKGGSGDEASNC
jgi:hypothetical protein